MGLFHMLAAQLLMELMFCMFRATRPSVITSSFQPQIISSNRLYLKTFCSGFISIPLTP